MERKGTGADGYVCMCTVHLSRWTWGMGRITRGAFPHRFWFSQLPHCLTGRENASDFSVCLLSIGLFHCFLFSSSSIYSGWVHAWEMRVGGNSEPCSGASVHPLRLSGLGWTLSCLPSFPSMLLSRELVTDPHYVPEYALGKLSCLFVLRQGVRGSFSKGVLKYLI